MNLLKGYYSVQKKFDTEKMIFSLLKSLPHVKYWWEYYWEIHNEDESMAFRKRPTLVDFVDSLKEEFYLVRKYDDQYTR